ncbi:MAG: hypothetical protein KBG48_24320 [Kofleriaceae bacterium]|jgi:hypothetical protein|nr:hypothetical protein [Kofleriaceae bacterium]MBP9170553.1 hypothetical protein [Kofleriaceae bacterium]MBP9860989.1 hypothetical protein [Kofleriaceae bacterium]
MARLGLAAVAVALAWPGRAAAEPGGFRLSEVATASSAGASAARYVELEATALACVGPSTRIVSYDAGGRVLGDAAPFPSARCIPAGTYFLLATPAAQVAFATTADAALVPPLDLDAGQLCLESTATRYDCVRWGAIGASVADLFGPDDASAAVPAPAGLALARIGELHVVAIDWRVESPTPRGPNDGTPWDPADAGVDAPRPDAAVDAALVDARRPDAAQDAVTPDASQEFVGLDPGGGAACGCGTGVGVDGAGLAAAVAAWLARRRYRRPA